MVCRHFTSLTAVALLLGLGQLSAHCQMPCGIYDDQMVYDQINQYYLTMFKGVKALENNKFQTDEDKNHFVRWVMTKDRLSDEVAMMITTYFLQQKILPIEDNNELLKSLHRLLFLLVAIKQNVDIKIVKDFGNEWEKFKTSFSPEIECVPVIKEPSDRLETEGKT